jgi:hypothetical protein
VTQYTRQEVEEILRRALQTQPLETLSHEDLVAAAVEAGIDAEDVEAAARQLEEERELRAEEDRIVSRRKQRFLQSIYTYVIVNSGLFLIDVMSGPGWWVQWVLAGWGIFLALGARRSLVPDRARLRARARRQVAKRRRGSWERQVRKEVDRAIQVGVDALVDAATKRIANKPKVRVEQPTEEVVEAEVVEEHRTRGR